MALQFLLSGSNASFFNLLTSIQEPKQTTEPLEIEVPLIYKDEPVRVIYDNRNILELGANLRQPIWQTSMPKVHPVSMEDKPIPEQSLLSQPDHKDNLAKKYSMKICKFCRLAEPLPYLHN